MITIWKVTLCPFCLNCFLDQCLYFLHSMYQQGLHVTLRIACDCTLEEWRLHTASDGGQLICCSCTLSSSLSVDEEKDDSRSCSRTDSFWTSFLKGRLLILERFRSTDPTDIMDNSQCNDSCSWDGLASMKQ